MGDPDFPTSDQRPEAGAPIQKKYKRGQFDPLGDRIFKVFVSTDFFIIYTASDETGGDVGRLRYILPDNYEDAKKYRTCLVPIAKQLAYVGDVIASMPRSQFTILRDPTRFR